MNIIIYIKRRRVWQPGLGILAKSIKAFVVNRAGKIYDYNIYIVDAQWRFL